MEYENEAVLAVESAEVEDLDIGNSRLGLGIILFFAAIIGIWGASSLLIAFFQFGVSEVITAFLASIL